MVCVTSNYTALLMINEISGVKETELRAFKLKVPAFAEDSGNYGRECGTMKNSSEDLACREMPLPCFAVWPSPPLWTGLALFSCHACREWAHYVEHESRCN